MIETAAPTSPVPAGPDSELAERIKSLAHALGFDLVGIASPEPSKETRFFREWIARGFAGEMALLTDLTRNATVAATTDSRVLHVRGGSFDVMLKRVALIAVKMLPVVAARVFDSDDHSE